MLFVPRGNAVAPGLLQKGNKAALASIKMKDGVVQKLPIDKV